MSLRDGERERRELDDDSERDRERYGEEGDRERENERPLLLPREDVAVQL